MDDPRVRLATADEIAAAILKVARRLNIVPGADALRHFVESMLLAEWKVAELHAAADLIPNDPYLQKQAAYASAPTPGVFAEAREHRAVFRARAHTREEMIAFVTEAASGNSMTMTKIGKRFRPHQLETGEARFIYEGP